MASIHQLYFDMVTIYLKNKIHVPLRQYSLLGYISWLFLFSLLRIGIYPFFRKRSFNIVTLHTALTL